MIADAINLVLQELSQILKVPPLKLDSNNTCLIKFKNGMMVQLELDRSTQFLILGIDLDVIPAGVYRENLFQAALKANSIPYPRNGSFAFSLQANRLVLFEMLHFQDLTGQKLADFLTPFMEKGKIWKDAISKGEIPVIQPPTSGRMPSGVFGLRP